MAPAGYQDPVLDTDLKLVNTPNSNDKNTSCGHLAFMITEALRAIEATAHLSSLLYESEPQGCPAKAAFLLISCHCAEMEPKQKNYIYKARSLLNDISAFVVQRQQYTVHKTFSMAALFLHARLTVKPASGNWAKMLKMCFTFIEENASGSMRRATSHSLLNFLYFIHSSSCLSLHSRLLTVCKYY